MKSAKHWLSEMLLSRERRRAARLQTPRLIAYYWDGAAPAAHKIRDISLTGFYLLTDARWYPGTLITMTLQTTYKSEDGARRFIAVQSVVVRADVDGVGLAFAAQEIRASNKEPSVEGNLVDKKTLHEFLKWIEGSRGEGSMEYILLPLLLPLLVFSVILKRRQGLRQAGLHAKRCRQFRWRFLNSRYRQRNRMYDSAQFSGSGQSLCSEGVQTLGEILKTGVVMRSSHTQRCSGSKP